jgi:hypothetical protein
MPEQYIVAPAMSTNSQLMLRTSIGYKRCDAPKADDQHLSKWLPVFNGIVKKI